MDDFKISLDDDLRARADTTTWEREQELIRRPYSKSWSDTSASLFASDTKVTRYVSLRRTTWKMECDRNNRRFSTFQLRHFQFFLVFSFASCLYIGPYTSITTHFLDLPVLSFSMISLSMIYRRVQPITMQFVYAEARHHKNMATYTFEKMYQVMVKLLWKLWQFIFPMIDVKCVLLQNFLYLLSHRIFWAPHFANRR